MSKIHVLLRKEELDAQPLPGKTVVVLDILFATTTVVAALAHGAVDVIPTLDGDTALAEAARRSPGSFVLSGELNARTLPGFCDPTPLALCAEDLKGKAVIHSTTNGTVALGKAREAEHVYAGALINGAALVRHISREHPDEPVLIVCAGSAENFNLEDFYGAGYLVSLFAAQGRPHEFTDAALAARLLCDGTDALDCLSRSRVGRMMAAQGLEREVAFAAAKDVYTVVPKLEDGHLRPA